MYVCPYPLVYFDNYGRNSPNFLRMLHVAVARYTQIPIWRAVILSHLWVGRRLAETRVS